MQEGLRAQEGSLRLPEGKVRKGKKCVAKKRAKVAPKPTAAGAHRRPVRRPRDRPRLRAPSTARRSPRPVTTSPGRTRRTRSCRSWPTRRSPTARRASRPARTRSATAISATARCTTAASPRPRARTSSTRAHPYQIIGADQKADGSWAVTLKVVSVRRHAHVLHVDSDRGGRRHRPLLGPGLKPADRPGDPADRAAHAGCAARATARTESAQAFSPVVTRYSAVMIARPSASVVLCSRKYASRSSCSALRAVSSASAARAITTGPNFCS